MTVNAILFDAFGTLCDISIKRRPFAQLARFHPDRRRAREMIMTRPLSLREAAEELQVQDVDLAVLEEELDAELASIRLYPEVIGVLEGLRASGVRIGIVSNLAAPYAGPLLRLLPFAPDACAWSFEVGWLKPDPRIFSWVCEQLGVAASGALMVGDTFADDYAGALAGGLCAMHLDRCGRQSRPNGAQTIHTLEGILPAIRAQSCSRSTGHTGSVGLS
ncbi:HAD family hydrolase [Paraburkholderia atlantica]|uniref:HAD family hydrolase n=1 Tax=Paraburkholderia atlantica TaxID=2654982 RepID=UPI001613D648|nr:HAD family hydrolase [Paraburkholderia atlantica]MBB5506943.1 HAD superfamily hydrolase (TIGR01549 family) [Paraburkholderia atlantica]